MDRRISYKIVLDTETCPVDKDFEGVSAKNMWTYDCGWAVTDKRGKIYRKRSFVNADIFLNEKELMNSAYYANKIPNYIKDLANGKRQLKTTFEIRQILCDIIKEYDCKFVMAHNARFDYRACNNIQRWTTKSKYRYFFPKDIEIWDTLKMANDVIAKMPTYQQFCFENGFVTKHKTPRPQLTAEVIYRFITNDLSFVESHTGLEDVEIELEIYKYCIKQHKQMRKKLFENF